MEEETIQGDEKMAEKNNIGEEIKPEYKERSYMGDWFRDLRWIPAAGFDIMGVVPWIFGFEDVAYAPIQTGFLGLLYAPEMIKLKDSKGGLWKVGGMYGASFLEELGAVTDPIPTGLIFHSVATAVNRHYKAMEHKELEKESVLEKEVNDYQL